jgi:DNA replication licensing factor MCM6
MLGHSKFIRKQANAQFQDNIIQQVRGEGLVDGDEEVAGSSVDAGRAVYVLHPNCAIEEM